MQAHVLPTICPRPFLKWAGGKARLIPQYESLFPQQFSTYYEPFLGGGAIFFHLQPRRAMLMDINAELVNVYCCVRDHADALIVRLQEHRDRHCPEYYYEQRSRHREAKLYQFDRGIETTIDKAARLIYLNKTCFNGLYRENSKGQFNVPMGRYKNPGIYDPGLLKAAAAALRSQQIIFAPFEAILNYATSKQDFVYFDPPYHPISPTSSFTAYNRYAFTPADQICLRDTFAELARRGVKVMLSNSDCPFVRELYQDFHIHTIYAARAINSKAERRGKITEILVTSYPS